MPKIKRKQLEIFPESGPATEDRRLFSRLALEDASLLFKDLMIGEKGNAICKDISGSGMGIESSREIKTKTPLELWLDLPDGYEPLHVFGKVVWSSVSSKSWRTGIVFDRPRLMGLSRILRFEV